MVYKLVEINGIPKIKLSDEVEKTTLPGEKLVLRVYNQENKPAFDLLVLASEYSSSFGTGSLTVYDAFKAEAALVNFTSSRIENLSELFFSEGQLTDGVAKSLSERRAACVKEIEEFGGAERLLSHDKEREYKVYLSEKLNTLARELLEKYGHA